MKMLKAWCEKVTLEPEISHTIFSIDSISPYNVETELIKSLRINMSIYYKENTTHQATSIDIAKALPLFIAVKKSNIHFSMFP